MDKFERGLLATNRWALIALLGAMSVIIFTNVAMRYLTDQSIEWAEEVARHMMIWLTFLGAGPVLRYGGHIAIDNLQDALPRRGAVAVRWLIAVLLTGFFGFMVWFGVLYVQRAQFQTTAATQISFGWIYAAMPVGGVLCLLHWFFILRGYLSDRTFASDEHFDANASASL
mgnify:CR=1 FL=1